MGLRCFESDVSIDMSMRVGKEGGFTVLEVEHTGKAIK
jgi:hypothetical protein